LAVPKSIERSHEKRDFSRFGIIISPSAIRLG